MEERLKKLRENLNLTQKDFALRLGLGQSTWAMIEVGKRELIDRHIKLICSEFGVNEDWLRTGEGEMFVRDGGKNLFFALGRAYPDMSEIEKNIIIAFLDMSKEERSVFTKWLSKAISPDIDSKLELFPI